MASQRVTGLLVLLLLVMAAGPLPRPADAAGRHKPGPRKPAGGPIGKPGGLSPLFYKRTCPQFESIVLSNMRKWLATDVNIAAMLVRLIFHDVVVNVSRRALPACSLSCFLHHPPVSVDIGTSSLDSSVLPNTNSVTHPPVERCMC